jgi:hypothetical protein
MAAVSISAAITGIGGIITWSLNLREIRLSNAALALEIDHVRADTERIRLEIQELTDEETFERCRSLVLGRIVGDPEVASAIANQEGLSLHREHTLRLPPTTKAAMRGLRKKQGRLQICWRSRFGCKGEETGIASLPIEGLSCRGVDWL